MTGRREWNDAVWPPFASAPGLACRNGDPERFFPKTTGKHAHEHAEQAKRVCRPCPQVTACLEWAIETSQDYGIWGATTARERRRMITGRAAA